MTVWSVTVFLLAEGDVMPKIPVTVYTLPVCVQCNQTKRVMDRLGIQYIEVELTAEKADEFKALGFTAAPIVTTDVKIWSGFRLSKIQSLADYIRSMERGN